MTRTVRPRRDPDAPKIGVDYARFSTKYQSSIGDQFRTNREVDAEYGIRNIESFKDEATSRSIGDRAGLVAMIAFCDEHPEVTHITVPELERLIGGLDQQADFKRFMRRRLITVATEDMGLIHPHDEKKMHEADTRSVKSEGEVITTRLRTRRQMKQKVANGLVSQRPVFGTRPKPVLLPDGQPVPDGLAPIDRRGRPIRSGEIEEHPEELPWLLKIFEWAAKGMSPLEIRIELRANGIRTKTGELAWANRTITGMIANPFYKGELIWGRRKTIRAGNDKWQEMRQADDPAIVRVPSPLGALVDPALWERANVEIARHFGKKRITHRTFPARALDGFTFCGRCGYRMYGRSDGNLGPDTPGRTLGWRYCCFGTGSMKSNRETLPGFPGGCNKPWTLSEKKILQAMATLGSPSALTWAHHNEQEHLAQSGTRKRKIETEVTSLAARRKAYGMNFADGDYGPVDAPSARQEKVRLQAIVDAEVTSLQAELATLDVVPLHVALPQLTVSSGEHWAELVALLADGSLPVEDRALALRDAGVERLYLDGPLVKVQLTDRHTSSEGGLLRLEHSNSTVDR